MTAAVAAFPPALVEALTAEAFVWFPALLR